MTTSKQKLLMKNKITIPTLGGRSKITFIFHDETIKTINSTGRETSFSWLNLDAVCNYCEKSGYLLPTSHYNPMDNRTLPENYPKNKDALSLVSLAHYMAGRQSYI